MNSKTTATSSAAPKPKLSLWFWISLACATILTLTSLSLNLAKNTRLNIAAQQTQTPLIELRETLLVDSDTLKSNWLKTLNPLAKKIQGDLIWNQALEKGVMKFSHLPELTGDQKYHLWIYDLEQSIKDPISATEFTADPRIKKNFLVEITPLIAVKKPYKFVLTLEEPSQEDQILLLAQP